jgi:hypothetical protein
LNFGTALTRTFGQCQRDIGGIPLAIKRQIDATGDIIDVQMFIPLLDFRGADFFDLNAKGTGHPGRAMQFFEPFSSQGSGN